MADLFFFLEVLIGGLLSGVLYSLVALGFVLIYKASGVFNFAQGAMVLLAGLTFVRLTQILGSEHPWDGMFVLALAITFAVMIALAFAVERVVLRPLVNQAQIIMFMATIGLTFFLEGAAQGVWGSQVHRLNLGVSELPIIIGDVLLPPLDLVAAAAAAAMVAGLAVFFSRTRIGRALRAVADDHQAALSVGIPLQSIWVVVWSVAGIVALFAGLVWGAKLGVQFSLTLVALKALPVLILGGFTSIPGAIIGGLIIGASEKLAEVFIGPLVGGAIENWFPYMLALVFLLFRPQGLFGEKIIKRV
ncbi:MAG: branched-chain amino acid ABC transporter permease [Alphaproteobacteria bacterium]|nr:branched-chain amino acid ABC transporter permease [Alphaproteobacteria bacterium]